MPYIEQLSDADTLMFEGGLALSRVSSNGMRVDLKYVKEARKLIKTEMYEIEDSLLDLKDVQHWQSKFGDNFKLSSPDQLRYMLFDYLGYEPIKQTKASKDSTDVEVLEQLMDIEPCKMIELIMRHKKLDKAYTTYLGGVLRETNEDGFLRPWFYLNTARTYRSSSGAINFQNIPTRNPEIKKLIRTAFLPREGRQILEMDFKGAEVSVAYCYHLDPTMRDYLLDPSKDMHRDMAQQIYILDETEWNKGLRNAAKNKFVFPSFYGSYYKQTSEDLYKYLIMYKSKIGKDNEGILVTEHLKKKGLGTALAFQDHIKKIEDHFWNVRFPKYTKWKEDHWEGYLRRGYFDSHTGFRYRGVFKRNEVINYPVQGSSFHCLLWVLTQTQKWLDKYKMKSLIIGQIHDSIVFDLHPDEKDIVLEKLLDIVTNKLPQRYAWLTIPMVIEAEIAPIDKPWYYKEELKLD